jgi:outer membrane protein assembly factor BamB
MMRRETMQWTRTAGSILLAAVVPFGLQGQEAQFRGGPAHVGVLDTRGVEDFGRVAWRFDAGSPIRGSAVVAAGMLYFGSTGGTLYAVDLRTGQKVWQQDVGAAVASTPAVTAGVVLVGARDGALHAISASDGSPLWTLRTGEDLALPWGQEGWDYLTSSPAVANGVAYWGSGDGHVYAVDAEAGGELWRFATGGRVRSTPAVVDGVVYVGSSDGFVYAVDAASGAERWRFETAGASLNAEDFGFDRRQIYGSPAVDGGEVLVGSRDASLYKLDAATGRLLWTFDEESAWVISSAAVTGDRVYSARSSSGNTRAIHRSTGAEVWSHAAGSLVFSSPVIVGTTLYIGEEDGDVVARGTESGQLLWSFRTGGSVFATPLVHDGRVYIGSDDGFLYAIEAPAGEALHRAVFFDEALMARSAFGGNEEHRAVTDHLSRRGYRTLNQAGLVEFMRARVDDGAPSVVVFGMDALPTELAGEAGSDGLLRRYLDGGGKVVWLGYPPGYLVWDDDTGQVVAVDRDRPAAILGLSFEAFHGDVHGVTVTDAGRAWGLSSRWVGQGNTLPSEVTQVLGRDEIGRAAAWVKSYGGREGTGFVLYRPVLEESELDVVWYPAEHFGDGGGRRPGSSREPPG